LSCEQFVRGKGAAYRTTTAAIDPPCPLAIHHRRRRDNEETASTDRLGEGTEPNLDGSDDDDENGGVDPDYF